MAAAVPGFPVVPKAVVAPETGLATEVATQKVALGSEIATVLVPSLVVLLAAVVPVTVPVTKVAAVLKPGTAPRAAV